MASKKGIYIFTLIGLLLGFTMDSFIRSDNTTLFCYTLISLFCLLYALAYDEKNLLRLIVSSFIVSLFLALPLLPIKTNSIFSFSDHWITFLCAFPVFAYAGHCFHYAFHHDNTWKINYSSLFAAVWNTIPLLLVAAVFTGLADLLILLGAFIFKTVGNTYLWNLYFDNEHFRIISNITLFFIGLGIGQQNIKIIYSLRFLLLRMMYYLFPVLAFISVMYFFLFLGHTATQNEEYINPLVILFPLVSIGIIFFNAYFQDGSVETEVPIWMKWLLRVYRVVLFLLAIMMTYKLFRENSIDVNVMVYIISMILYTLTYAITAWFAPVMEQKWVRRGNICTALYFIIVLFLLNLPYAPIAFNVGTEPAAITPTVNK